MTWTTLSGSGGIVVNDGRVLDRRWTGRETGFHMHAGCLVHADGTQSLVFQS
jgi:hypothetical protein